LNQDALESRRLTGGQLLLRKGGDAKRAEQTWIPEETLLDNNWGSHFFRWNTGSLCNFSEAKKRKDEIMEAETMEMFAIDTCALDVEELEERLELASLFATKASGRICNVQVLIDWGAGGGGGGGGGSC
jgi:hypothetical protein